MGHEGFQGGGGGEGRRCVLLWRVIGMIAVGRMDDVRGEDGE